MPVHNFTTPFPVPPGIQVLKTNAFCPTGKGGGVDPSCSPGKSGGGRSLHKINSTLRLSKLSEEEPYLLRHVRKGDLLQISVQRKGDELHFSDIRSFGSGTELVNKIGPKVVMKVLRAIKEDHPGVKKLTGTRSWDRLKGGGRIEIATNATITSLTATDLNGNEFRLPKSAITNELVQSLTTNATVRPNPLLMDPTGTGKERKALERAIMSRLKMLKQAIVETIVTEDVFGLKDRPSVYTSNVFCPTGKGGGVDPTCGKGQSNRDYKTLTRTAAKSEGFQVADSSDPGMSDKLQSEEKRIFDLMGEMEEAGNDQGHEYEALFMMSRVLYTHNNLKLSEKQNTRTSFVLKDGKVVAGGLMTWDSKKKEAFVKYVGSTERGAGKYVMASLLQKAKDKGITIVKADASDEAVPYNRRFGFDVDGPKNENGIPMSLALNELTFNLASTQVDITDPKILTTIIDIQSRIDPADLVEFEDKSHITVRYGLHDIEPERVERIAQQHSSVRAKLGGLSIFPAKESDSQRGGPEYDVLKIDVSSKDLESINRHLGILPNTTTHPDYHPHLTIAYLKPGTGQKYVGASGLEGVELEFKSMVYSDDDRNKTEIVFNAFCPTGKGGGVDPSCSPGKGGVGKSTNEEESKFQSRADDLSTKLKQYSSEYKTEGKSDLSEQADKVAGLLDAGKYEEASKLLLEGDLRYDIPQTVTSANKLKDDVYLAREFGSDWGTKPGEYEAWRSGGLDSPRGVFFSVDKKGAESYGDEVQSHKVTLKNPLVSTRLEAAYAKLTGRSESEVISQRQKSKNVNDWWQKLDKKVKQEAKKAGYDSVLYTDPAPPAIRELVVFDKKQITTNELTTNAGIWEFITDDQKVDEFIKWIRSQMSVAVLGTMTTLGTTDPDHWLMKHISDVYTKGMGKVFEFIRKPVFAEKMPHYEGTKAEFLKSAFTRPVSPNRVKLLAGRAFSELSGMTDKMATQMQRSLTDGFIRGESPRDIARQLVKDVDGLGRKQANMIASTEITRAYNEGQLDSMEELGVEDVGVSVEWRVSKQGVTVLGNPSPCPVCAPLNGIVLKISEARGLLPRHPHCRCAWVASGVGESTKGQKRSQQRIVQAVKSSLMAERPKRKKTAAKPSRWAGSKAKIGKNRPKSILD